MLYFIDSNIFLRILTKDNKAQFNACTKILKSIKENKIDAYCSTIILAEVIWTLQSFYHFKKDESVRALKSIINLRGLKIINKYDHLKAADLYSKYSVKFIDALIASDTQIIEKKTQIVSYDKDFDKLPVTRKEPDEVLKNL